MEKEQVIEKLEEVFTIACERYSRGAGSITEIRELGQTIIHAKQNIYKDIRKAEEFIEQRVKELVNHSR